MYHLHVNYLKKVGFNLFAMKVYQSTAFLFRYDYFIRISISFDIFQNLVYHSSDILDDYFNSLYLIDISVF